MLTGFGLICLLIAAVVAWLAHVTRAEARASRQWPTTQGVITRCDVTVRELDSGNEHKLEVAYTYTVDGATHDGDRVGPGGSPTFSTEELARPAAQKYATGTTVTVWYDPQDPATSLLDPNEEGPYAARAGIAIVVGALGLLAILLDLSGCVPG